MSRERRARLWCFGIAKDSAFVYSGFYTSGAPRPERHNSHTCHGMNVESKKRKGASKIEPSCMLHRRMEQSNNISHQSQRMNISRHIQYTLYAQISSHAQQLTRTLSTLLIPHDSSTYSTVYLHSSALALGYAGAVGAGSGKLMACQSVWTSAGRRLCIVPPSWERSSR